MIRRLFCLLPLALIVSCSFAQRSTLLEKDFLSPQIDTGFVNQQKVKSIQSKDYTLTSSGAKKEEGSAELFTFDSDGHLVQQVEIDRHDTSSVRNIFYTAKGAIKWEVFEDKNWNRIVKSGYRNNSQEKVFQVKSYEMLNSDSKMLVDTRQYRYRTDGQPEMILSLTNNQVTESHYFEYDKKDRLVEERLKNGEGELMSTINYQYNSRGWLKKVTRANYQRGHHMEEFNYAYNNSGGIVSTQWKEGDDIKGVINYEYDPSGVLLRVQSSLNKNRRQEKKVKEFEYQFFEK